MPEVLPEIVKYLSTRDFGEILSAEAVDTSPRIPTQRVYFTSGIIYSFHVTGGRVVGVSNETPKPVVPQEAPIQDSAPSSHKPTKPGELDKSPEMQLGRKEFIEKLIRDKILAKVERTGGANSVPKIWVEPAFYLLDFDTKQKFLSVVYAYSFDGSNDLDVLVLYDNYTGKEIGEFSIVRGGLHLK